MDLSLCHSKQERWRWLCTVADIKPTLHCKQLFHYQRRLAVNSTLGMSDAWHRASMLRFHLDYIHVLRYLLRSACMGVYIYSMNGKCLGCLRVCLWVSAHCTTIRSANKALAIFNFQGCQPDQGTTESWYVSLSRRALLCLHFIHRYPETYEGEFELLSESNTCR